MQEEQVIANATDVDKLIDYVGSKATSAAGSSGLTMIKKEFSDFGFQKFINKFLLQSERDDLSVYQHHQLTTMINDFKYDVYHGCNDYSTKYDAVLGSLGLSVQFPQRIAFNKRMKIKFEEEDIFVGERLPIPTLDHPLIPSTHSFPLIETPEIQAGESYFCNNEILFSLEDISTRFYLHLLHLFVARRNNR